MCAEYDNEALENVIALHRNHSDFGAVADNLLAIYVFSQWDTTISIF